MARKRQAPPPSVPKQLDEIRRRFAATIASLLWDGVTMTVIPDPLRTAEMEAAAQEWLALIDSLGDDAHHGQKPPAS